MKHVFYAALLCFFSVMVLHAHDIQGRVVDAESKEPLPAVNVRVLNSTRGASTSVGGRFVIENLPAGRYRLQVSRIGYSVQTVDVLLSDSQHEDLLILLEETALEADPIVVLGGKVAQRLDESSVAMSVLSSVDIARRTPVNIKQALETVPGVHFIGDQINIRGSTGFTFGAGNKVLLLLDGVPVYAADTGEFNWDMLPPMDIEQIEVLKGAGSTLWGASALGGVVNIITAKPSSKGTFKVSWGGGIYDKPYYKTWDWTDRLLHYTREDVSYSRQSGPVGFYLSAGRLNSTGYNQLGDALKLNATAKTVWQLPNGWKWTVYGAYSRIRKGYFVQWKGPNDPYEVDESNLNNKATVHQLNLYSRLALPVSDKLLIQLRASLVRSLMGNQFGQGSGFNPAYGQGLEAQVTWIPSVRHSITAGLQFQMDSGSTDFFGSHRGYSLGPYIQDEIMLLESLKATLGARYDRYKLIDGAIEDLFSPRLGVNWTVRPGSIVRASAGTGFRAATIVERFLELSVMNFNIIANPELKAERSLALDVGFKQYIGRHAFVDLSLFSNTYTDLIEAHLNLIRGQIQFRNIHEARVSGIEMSSGFESRFTFGRHLFKPMFECGFTWMRARDTEWDEALSYRPEWLGYVKTALEYGAWRISADYRYASRIEAVKVYPINNRVPMHFVDLHAQYSWRFLTIHASVKNSLEYNYAPMESNLMAPRTWSLTLKGQW